MSILSRLFRSGTARLKTSTIVSSHGRVLDIYYDNEAALGTLGGLKTAS